MIKAKLIRIERSEKMTLGVLIIEDEIQCLTLERPWKKNRRNVSCIRPGEYFCQRVFSPKHGDTFQVMDVEGRSNILFHKGNDVSESLGCILLGNKCGKNYLENRGVLESGLAFKAFMNRLARMESFNLEIVEGIC